MEYLYQLLLDLPQSISHRVSMNMGFKAFASTVCILAIIVTGWYMISRACQKHYPVKIFASDDPQPSQTSENFTSLKLGSYNIAHARGGKRKASNFQFSTRKELYSHLDRLAEQIRQEDLDVVILNEVDFKSAWSHHVNVAEYLMKKGLFGYRLEQLNMSASVPFWNFRYGNAVLSKYPISNATFLDFPPVSRLDDILKDAHDGVYCEIATPNGNLGILPVHLDHRSEDVRVASVKIMLDKIAHVDLPVLAVGDFNSTLIDKPLYQTSRQGQNAMEYLLINGRFTPYLSPDLGPERYTFPSERPDRIIDWIAGRDVGGFVNPQVISSGLSDHFMITSEVVLSPSSQVKYLTHLP